MALRDQPYLPLYIQDFLTDEKLIECSAQATGVYIRLMCIFHKSEDYGKILLKQKDKQTDDRVLNFAIKIGKQMPYNQDIIYNSLTELLGESVLHIEGDYLVQKRMVNDNLLSLKRAEAGSKGGKFTQAKNKATNKANTEIENENAIENVIDTRIGGMGERIIEVDGRPVDEYSVMQVLEFYEVQLNGTQRENGNIAWKPMVSKWFAQHIGEAFSDGNHVKNSFKKFYLNAPRNGKVITERNIDHL